MVAALIVLFLPVCAYAHGGGVEYPVSLPVTYALYGGVISVLATFFIGLFWENTDTPHARRELLVPKVLIRCIQVCALVVCVWGWYGNALHYVVWMGLCTALPLLALMCDGLWMFPPARQGNEESFSIAPLLLLALFSFELFTPWSEDQTILSYVVLGYLAASVVLSYVVRSWWRHHELFGTLYRTIGSVAPFTYAGGKILRRPYIPKRYSYTSFLFISVLITGTTFDGLLHSTYFSTLARYLGFQAINPFHQSVLFLVAILIFCTFYAVAILIMKDDVSDPSTGDSSPLSYAALFQYFTPILIPIAVGYLLAHNCTRITFLFSGPYAVYGWVAQVLLIIIGHVWGTLLAHHIANKIFHTEVLARRSQYALLVAMLIITTISLWMLQAPQ